MYITIHLASLTFESEGFTQARHGDRLLFTTPSCVGMADISELGRREYAQAVEISMADRSVRFGRDYLGHFPLLYACTKEHLFISDEYPTLRDALQKMGQALSFSEETFALYFTMGYVPQGVTLVEQIKTCENATLYVWRNGKITAESLFHPVEEDSHFPLEKLKQGIEESTQAIGYAYPNVDVWCSGGLDSSIVATNFHAQGKSPRLLTLDYDEDIRGLWGVGELPYAQAIAEYLQAPLVHVPLTRESYRSAFDQLVRGHPGPVFDIAILPKYTLARSTRLVAATGEGGDPLFAGVKNTAMLFMQQNGPKRSFGEMYAVVHDRYFQKLRKIFTRGKDLEVYVVDYFNRLYDRFPGSLLRRLFYLNTFMKQGGLIFPESYYAGKRAGVDIRHPLTGLPAYEAAFSLPDNKKYQYPEGKIALIELYRNQLPTSIVERKKSGTRIALDYYLNYVIEGEYLSLQNLNGIEWMRQEYLQNLTSVPWRDLSALEVSAFVTLDNWLSHNGGQNAHAISRTRRSFQ